MRCTGGTEDAARLQLLRDTLALFEGTHPFHNYTTRRLYRAEAREAEKEKVGRLATPVLGDKGLPCSLRFAEVLSESRHVPMHGMRLKLQGRERRRMQRYDGPPLAGEPVQDAAQAEDPNNTANHGPAVSAPSDSAETSPAVPAAVAPAAVSPASALPAAEPAAASVAEPAPALAQQRQAAPLREAAPLDQDNEGAAVAEDSGENKEAASAVGAWPRFHTLG